jgi:ceramide glucosyltransferase
MDESGLDLAALIDAAPAALIDATPLVSLLYGLAIAACLYTLFSIYSLRRFARASAPDAEASPAITLLKPLYGAEPGLYEHLTSFCRQDYAGPVQILFGVQDAEDPAAIVARKIVNALRAGKIDGAPAGMTAELVIDPARHGANGKVGNLINLSRRIEHGVVVLADSDIRVAPDYLARLAQTLARPGVGLVTCLYRGAPMAGLWSTLGAMWVDYGFLPNVVTGVTLKMADPCIGATIALRRDTLDAIGGFRAIQDQLADDYALGEAVRGIGQKVVLADFAVGHAHGETSPLQLWRREMRWSRTIRSLNPVGYIGSAVTFPLAWALLALLAGGFAPTGAILTFAALLCRLTLQDEVDRRFPGLPHALWLSPLRDLLSFAVFVVSFFPGQVHWRGRDFSMGAHGVMAPVEPKSEAEETEAEAA